MTDADKLLNNAMIQTLHVMSDDQFSVYSPPSVKQFLSVDNTLKHTFTNYNYNNLYEYYEPLILYVVSSASIRPPAQPQPTVSLSSPDQTKSSEAAPPAGYTPPPANTHRCVEVSRRDLSVKLKHILICEFV